MVHSRYKSCVFPYSTRWCILAQNTWLSTCAFAVQTKQSVISFGFLFQRLLWRHCKTFNRNGEKRKLYSSTCSGIFYSGGPLRNQKSPRGHVQGLLLVHFDPFCFCLFWWKLSRYLKTVGRTWQSKNMILFLYTTPNCTEEQRRISCYDRQYVAQNERKMLQSSEIVPVIGDAIAFLGHVSFLALRWEFFETRYCTGLLVCLQQIKSDNNLSLWRWTSQAH